MMQFSSTVVTAAAVILVVAIASTPTAATTTANTSATSSISTASSLHGVVAPTTRTKSDVTTAVKTSTATTRDLRIVGGEQSEEGEFPYFVGMGGCGGALIAPSVVLFAAHCLDYKDQQVNIGSYKIYSADFGAQPAFCNEWIADPTYTEIDYYGDGFGVPNNDFALCLLDKEVIVNTTSVKLILNTDSNVPSVVDGIGDDLIVMGLGHLASGAVGPEYVHDVTVPTVSNADCNSDTSYGGSINDNMLCAGFADGGKGSCQGDSGGPVVKRTILADGTKVDTHVGVVSWGDGCGEPNLPGVYARTSSGSTWIIDQVCNVWGVSADFCPTTSNNVVDDVFDNCDQKLVIQLTTDRFGSETSSILQEKSTVRDDVLIRKYLVQFYKNEHKVCLKSNTCYDFSVHDSYGDGMCDEFGNNCGSYQLELNGVIEVIGDPDFTFKSPSYEICTDDATASPTASPSASPSASPTASASPTSTPSATPTVSCGGSTEPVRFKLEIGTDEYGEETSWELKETTSNGMIAFATPDTYNSLLGVVESYCLKEEVCYTFIIRDSIGDGICCEFGDGYYRGILDGITIFEGGSFELEETQTFCVSASPSEAPTFSPTSSPTSFPTTTKNTKKKKKHKSLNNKKKDKKKSKQ